MICYYGIPVLRECRDGLQYNVETDRCDFPQYVDCVDNECSALIQPENIIFMASKANCSKYYICADGRAWSQECSAGLIYNPEFKYCDFERNYNCTVSRRFDSVLFFSILSLEHYRLVISNSVISDPILDRRLVELTSLVPKGVSTFMPIRSVRMRITIVWRVMA